MNLYGPHPFDNIVTANDARMHVGRHESLFSVAHAHLPEDGVRDIKNKNKCVALVVYLSCRMGGGCREAMRAGITRDVSDRPSLQCQILPSR